MFQIRGANRIAPPLAGAAVAALLLAGCGDDDDVAVEDPLVEDVDTLDDELLSPQLNGLEVTATGNVVELVDENAFQIDKDGLGDEDSTALTDDDVVLDYDVYDFYDYDYDYYDFPYYTDFDAEFDDYDETAVLVVTPNGSEVTIEDAVQVNGTLRYFDEATLESIYEVDFDDELYGSYENQYVIVADSVKSLPENREDAMAGDTSMTSAPADSTTTTAADG